MKASVSREQAEAVRDIIAARLTFVLNLLVLRDHHHEQLSPGAWSMGYEGCVMDRPWPVVVAEWQHEQPALFPADVRLEPLYSWCLGIYPNN